MDFDEQYYKKIIETYQYTEAVEPHVAQAMRELFGPDLRDTVVACSNLFPLPPKDRIYVITGFGINSAPHLGTFYVIRHALALQQRGFFVHMVLGDLDVRNTRSAAWNSTEPLVSQYKAFLQSIGFFDDGKRGRITSQFENVANMRTAFMLACAVNDQDFEDLEEDIFSLYMDKGVYQGLSFGVKQAMLLQLADFISPIFSEGFDKVIALSGIDEHRFASKANDVCQRYLGRSDCIAGIFLKIICGLNFYPKMSKSLSKSGITLDMNKEQIDSLRARFQSYQAGSREQEYAASIMSQSFCGNLPYDEMLSTFFLELEYYTEKWRALDGVY